MGVKEKLIELLTTVIFVRDGVDPAEAIADFLIDSGVTIQKWIPVTERLPNFYPDKRRTVLVTLKDNDGKPIVTTAKYHEEHKYWYYFKDSRFVDFEVLAWMLKPDAYEPPKEDGA